MIQGLSPERVRELTAEYRPQKTRDRKPRTHRARVYGWLKVAVANLPADGMLTGSKADAEKYQAVARRMGIKVRIERVGEGPTRRVLPALSGAELSLDCSQL